MEVTIKEYFDENHLNSPVDEIIIKQEEEKLNIYFPDEYKKFFLLTNGYEGNIGSRFYVSFWKIEDIQMMNEGYDVNKYAKGLLLFGSDGGDTAYGFDTRKGAMAIISVPFIGMGINEIVLLGNNFNSFVKGLAEAF